MKVLVGYNGGKSGELSLKFAADYAKKNNAFVYIITSLEGGASEKLSDIAKVEKHLEFAAKIMKESGLNYDARQIVRGLSPGEDIVLFTKENSIDHIFLGIKKKSRAQKIILGSTVQYVVLKAPCPVTTINS